MVQGCEQGISGCGAKEIGKFFLTVDNFMICGILELIKSYKNPSVHKKENPGLGLPGFQLG